MPGTAGQRVTLWRGTLQYCRRTRLAFDLDHLTDAHELARMLPPPVTLPGLRRSCATCKVKHLCLPRNLEPAELQLLDAVVGTRVLKRNEMLYHSGERLVSIYAVRSGSVAVHVAAAGVEQVVGFYLPGELVGLDALQRGRHTTECMALEPSNLCRIPYQRLEEFCARMPTLHHQFARLMSKEISGEHRLLLSLGHLDLEQRLATFLLDLSRRWKGLGYSAIRFRLSMRRDHVASYLGTSAESISRAFSRLRDAGILDIHGKDVRLVDLKRLVELSGSAEEFGHLLSA